MQPPNDYGTGDKLVSYFADVPLPEHEIGDFVLPERKPPTPIDFNTGLGILIRSYFEDIPPPKNKSEEFIISSREIETAIEFK